jgi:signal transduction histidine kinase
VASRSLPSLRLWLQSSSLLAVLAGYSLLFAVSRGIAEADRLDRHQQLVATFSRELQSGQLQLPLPSGLGVEARWSSAASEAPPSLVKRPNGSVWLVSRTAFPSTGNGLQRALEVRQNITASLQRGQRELLLLIAAAGGSVLFTSGLLRLVIWRGLILPMARLTTELENLQADSLGQRSLDVAAQPQELQPIVTAFNRLQSRLATAWQRERRFVDGVAHELRTPITVISSHAQSLQSSSGEASGRVVGLIAAEAERMGALISVMLDFARGDSGRLGLALEPTDPEALLLEAYERLLPLDPSRLLLAPALRDPLDWIEIDRERVQQCLAALVDNALKYSTGPVELALSQSPSSVVLHVLDRGSGIPELERAAVVQRFARGSTAVGTRGSGIGLATVTLLMEAMQAELRIADRSRGGADLQLRFSASDRPPAP